MGEQTITAYQYERDVPGNRRNEWQTVTEYSLTDPAIYPARHVTIALSDRVRVGTYRQASWNVTRTDDAACLLVDIGGGFNRGEQAYSLEEAIDLGYARVIGE